MEHLTKYKVQEVGKALAALVVSVLALVALFVTVDPNLPAATAAVVLAGTNVAAVFYTRNRPVEPADGAVIQAPEDHEAEGDESDPGVVD